ncbi:MAG: hypothetical protein FWH35_01245 [Treponema sp.]|nr:hypothetical protein [Treponema sp.]
MGYIEYENNAWFNLYWKGSADRIKTLKKSFKTLNTVDTSYATSIFDIFWTEFEIGKDKLDLHHESCNITNFTLFEPLFKEYNDLSFFLIAVTDFWQRDDDNFLQFEKTESNVIIYNKGKLDKKNRLLIAWQCKDYEEEYNSQRNSNDEDIDENEGPEIWISNNLYLPYKEEIIMPLLKKWKKE